MIFVSISLYFPDFSSWTFGHEHSTSFLPFVLLSDIGRNFSVSFFLRSLKSSGLLFQLRRAGLQETEGDDPYFTMYLEMGRVQVTSVAESPTLSAPVFVCNGEKPLLQLDIQEGWVFFSHGGLRYRLGSLPDMEVLKGDLVYVGGVPGEEGATDWGGQFKGCLQDLRLDDVHLAVEPWNSTLSETIYFSSEAENVLPGCISDDTCKVCRHTFLFSFHHTCNDNYSRKELSLCNWFAGGALLEWWRVYSHME